VVAALTRSGSSAVIPEASRPQPSRTPPIQIAMPSRSQRFVMVFIGNPRKIPIF